MRSKNIPPGKKHDVNDCLSDDFTTCLIRNPRLQTTRPCNAVRDLDLHAVVSLRNAATGKVARGVLLKQLRMQVYWGTEEETCLLCFLTCCFFSRTGQKALLLMYIYKVCKPVNMGNMQISPVLRPGRSKILSSNHNLVGRFFLWWVCQYVPSLFLQWHSCVGPLLGDNSFFSSKNMTSFLELGACMLVFSLSRKICVNFL